MAIILEQQKKPLGAKAIVMVAVILGVIGTASYFIFFSKVKEPQIPSQGDATGGVTKIHAEEFTKIAEDKIFSGLQQYPRLNQDVVKTHLGRTDPFQKF